MSLGARSHTAYERHELAQERSVNKREPLWFPASARLIPGLGRQQRRVKRQRYDLLIDREVTSADIGDLPLLAAVHESLFFAWLGNWVVCGAALPVPAQHEVEDHSRIINGGGRRSPRHVTTVV